MKFSVVIPVYKNEESIPRLLAAVQGMNLALDGRLEAVFVVDGSPDQSYAMLRDALPAQPFAAQLLAHSRNFGSFPAIRSGLQAARGEYFAVMAADLQEPPELVVEFFNALERDECDVAIGTRTTRQDPLRSRLASGLFWGLYRRLVVHDMPEGGVDVFGCNRQFRDQLLQLEESRSSLIALIFWLGYRRKLVAYDRQVRQEGKSAWTFSKKLDYMMDSIFAFTDYPIRMLIRMGTVGTLLSIGLGLLVAAARLSGAIAVPGYAATMLVVLLFGTLNLLGLGLVGTYAWRGYENSKQRPLAVVAAHLTHIPDHRLPQAAPARPAHVSGAPA
ncbi:glycosyltransferase family 2 protein [Pseudoduganella sp. LjRoot289]|uniref:glycosyltransferase family 2 protein n=1 Tax=Pseudoduganella sp. LjRoot289 TaxID=3342314 RepID=UPI003ED00B92